MKYAKMLLAVVATVLTALVGYWTDGVTPTEWVNVAISGTTALAVFAAPNVPGSRYTKSILAVLMAVLSFLVSAIVGGITTEELMQIAILALGALGVYAIPNSGPKVIDGTVV